ncbi:MAG: hypothetical protein OEY59_05185 [Deltaproteobacteria bacterium]|nr:hypothetical protein [Deltaproteobacteria bacterium]
MLAVVSAVLDEISPLVGLLKARPDEREGCFLFEGKNQKILLAPLGVSFLKAGLEFQSLLYQFPGIKEVLFVGTAGFYGLDNKTRIWDLCLAEEVFLIDGAAEMGLAKYAKFMEKTGIHSTLRCDWGLNKTKIATTLGMTINPGLSGRIAQNTGAEIENMELYSVAALCQEKEIFWNALLGITNKVGPEAHRQWTENHLGVQKKACELLFQQFTK